MHRGFAFIVVTLIVAGCGGRSLPASAVSDGAPAPDVSAGAGRNTAPPPAPPATLPRCVLALKVDSCCPSPTPVTTTELAQDPCLVPWPYHAAQPDGCVPPSCPEVVCDWREPPTRTAKGLPDGTCTWDSECQTDADCAMALAWSTCGCGCVQGVPRALLDPTSCLTEPQADPPPGDGCSPICDAMAPPCSQSCVAGWTGTRCEPSKTNSAYKVCILVGSK
jgi:hypothetical protein